MSAHGMLTRLKIGGPIVTLRPVAASEIRGNVVSRRTVAQIPTSIMLLKRKLASRDRTDSIRASDPKPSRRAIRRASEPKNTIPRNHANAGPMSEVANECTEEMIPLRVRNVPKIERQKVRITSVRFQTFIIPFFSWSITEWRNAVPVSQGIKDAFSTGSHAQ